MSEKRPRPADSPEPRKPLPRWKKVLLLLSCLLFLAGGALKAYTHFSGPGKEPARHVTADPRTGGAGLVDGGASGLQPFAGKERLPGEGVAGEPAGARAGSDGALEEWSPALMKGGMSFFIGFCVGYALRAFFKVSALLIGVILLGVFALSYWQVIPPIHWEAIQEHFDRIVASLKEQASGFREFIAGNLPSTGLASAGLLTGFKKN